jgi:hypothetical protein
MDGWKLQQEQIPNEYITLCSHILAWLLLSSTHRHAALAVIDRKPTQATE